MPTRDIMWRLTSWHESLTSLAHREANPANQLTIPHPQAIVALKQVRITADNFKTDFTMRTVEWPLNNKSMHQMCPAGVCCALYIPGSAMTTLFCRKITIQGKKYIIPPPVMLAYCPKLENSHWNVSGKILQLWSRATVCRHFFRPSNLIHLYSFWWKLVKVLSYWICTWTFPKRHFHEIRTAWILCSFLPFRQVSTDDTARLLFAAVLPRSAWPYLELNTGVYCI